MLKEIEKAFRYDKIFNRSALELLKWAYKENDRVRAIRIVNEARKIEEQYRNYNDCVNDRVWNHSYAAKSLSEPEAYLQTNQLGLQVQSREDELEPNNCEEKSLKEIANEIGEKLAEKNKAYGNSVNETHKILKVFLQKYRNEDGTYTIPESVIDLIARQSRVIDKQFRLFSNPEQDLLDEDPNADMAGYSIIAYKERNQEV